MVILTCGNMRENAHYSSSDPKSYDLLIRGLTANCCYMANIFISHWFVNNSVIQWFAFTIRCPVNLSLWHGCMANNDPPLRKKARGDADGALNKYKSMDNLEEQGAEIWSNLGLCFFRNQKLIAAISCLRKSIWISPLNFNGLFNLGYVFIKGIITLARGISIIGILLLLTRWG